MGQTLTNNIYLPDEGERNCYAGLAANWRALDAHLGNTDIHVTYADKQAWNEHVADTVKHVTAEDKAKWDAVTSKADDSDVLHKTGNETVEGNKTFNGDTRCVGELNQTVPFKMTSDTSFVTGTKNTRIYDQNGFLCANEPIIYNNNKNIRRAWYLYNNSSGATVSAGFNFILAASGQKVFYPLSDGDTDNGSNSAYWKNTYTKLINGLSPSSLCMPSSSGAIDISGYITDLSGTNVSRYTPLASGYIIIACNSTNVDYIKISNNLDFISIVDNTNNQFTSGNLGAWQPCLSGVEVQIRIKASALLSAKFYPCQGNI